MFKHTLIAIGITLMSFQVMAANTVIEMKTSMGNIEIELFNDKAPISTQNFESYIKDHFYHGTLFHRVIPDFMIQGGGMDVNMQEKKTKAPIQNESYNGLKNTRGTLAMARTNHPNSATSQFFINVVDNDFLNKSQMNAGYAVFGKVTKGMNIIDQMAKVPTTNLGIHQNVPQHPIKIINMSIKTTAPQQ
jgi:peptidyl-prolyl cis-trans isomerase A (cyclophilin A)